MYLNCICIIEKNIFGESIGSQYWNEMDCVCVSKRQCVFVCGRIFYLKCPSGSSQVVVIVHVHVGIIIIFTLRGNDHTSVWDKY